MVCGASACSLSLPSVRGPEHLGLLLVTCHTQEPLWVTHLKGPLVSEHSVALPIPREGEGSDLECAPSQGSSLVGLGWSRRRGYMVRSVRARPRLPPCLTEKLGSQSSRMAESFDVLLLRRGPKGHRAGV